MTTPSWNTEDLTFDETLFSGVTRLFPLPNLVLYPHVVQPLHIYEERYREMVVDALATDRLITMSILEPGWETDYDSRPPVAPVGCLGKIITHHRIEDGCFNLLLLGMRRVRISRELEPIRAFRQAEVELLTDCYTDDTSLDPELLRHNLLEEFRQHLPKESYADPLDQILSRHIPLGALTDLVSYTLPLAPKVKQELLNECQVEVRAQLLIQQFRQPIQTGPGHPAGKPGFPPSFSTN
jgi:Lon protease-like protein